MEELVIVALGRLLHARSIYNNRLRTLGLELDPRGTAGIEEGTNLRRVLTGLVKQHAPAQLETFENILRAVREGERVWAEVSMRYVGPAPTEQGIGVLLSAANAPALPFDIDEVGFVTAHPKRRNRIPLSEIEAAVDAFASATAQISTISKS